MTEAVLEAGSWIYKMLVTLVLAIVCIGMVGLVVRTEANTIDLQRELLFNRILYDPNGILYVDRHDVTHAAVIDKARFEQTRVATAFSYLPNYGGASLTLTDGTDVRSVTVNGPTYENIKVSSEAGIVGGGTLVTRTYPVIIHDNGARREGWLAITVAVPSRA